MTRQSKELGNKGETLAATLLQQKNHRLLARNLRTKYGEIDILSREGKTIVVTEVKTKTSDFFGAAIEMITPAKQRKLVLLTQLLQAQYQTDNVRIDVVAIDFVQQNRSAAKNNAQGEPRLRHYPGVIEFHG